MLAEATVAGIRNIVGTEELSYPKNSPNHECSLLFCCFSVRIEPLNKLILNPITWLATTYQDKIRTGNWSFWEFVKDVIC